MRNDQIDGVKNEIFRRFAKDIESNLTCELQQLLYVLTELYQGQLERRLHSGINSLQLNLRSTQYMTRKFFSGKVNVLKL